jgi:hypothetical protein
MIKRLSRTVLTTGPLGHLPVPGRDIVTNRVPKEVLFETVLGAVVSHILADDEGKLPFVVEKLARRVDENIIIGASKSTCLLVSEEGSAKGTDRKHRPGGLVKTVGKAGVSKPASAMCPL